MTKSARVPTSLAKSPTRGRRRKTAVPGDLERLVRQALPEHVVELQGHADESWFGEAEEGVRSRLAGLAGAGLAFERSPDPERPGLDDDSQVPAPETGERVRSYRLFFVAPTASWARFDVEDERPVDLGEEPPGKGNGERLVRVKGRQQVGCAVGVSLLPPVGLVRLDSMTTYEDGACDEPDIQPKVFDLDFKPIDPHQYFAELYEGEELSALFDLERKAAEALTSLGIRVISTEEAVTVVPFLRVGEAFIDKPVRLQDAFFFEAP